MHFVTGGAFNGKSSWVREYYRIEESSRWFSGCRGDELPGDLHFVEGLMVVIEGIEHGVKELLTNHSAEEIRELWGQYLQNWLQWEQGKQGRVVCLIGSDITKGIVPASAAEREWRDTAGRIFQDTTAACERVDLIWYGIGKRLK